MAKIRRLFYYILIIVFSLFPSFVFSLSMEERFQNKDALTYQVSFNGVPSGHIEWKYLGIRQVEGKPADVLLISSDTAILKLLNLTSDESVFLDVKTHLPVKVERNIILFGKKENIEELYNQKEGYVQIIRKNSATKEEILRQKPPIHNILALLYFFPQNIGLKKDKWMAFNLPTQKIKIKFIEEKYFGAGNNKQKAYFLIGRGEKKFNIWLDKETRLPLRLEFIFPVGKIVITRVNIDK